MTTGEGLVGFAERHLELQAGGSLRYFVAGAGPSLLLVHGLGGSAFNWVAVGPGSRRPVPRAGARSPRPRAFSPQSRPSGSSVFADELPELIRREQASPVAVVGHSLGGLVGVRLAVRHPDLVGGVLLAAAAAGISSGRRAARLALEILAALRPARRLAPHRVRIAGSPLLDRIRKLDELPVESEALG